jgi:hypothetical protein
MTTSLDRLAKNQTIFKSVEGHEIHEIEAVIETRERLLVVQRRVPVSEPSNEYPTHGL